MLPYSQLWARRESKVIENESSQKVETGRKQGASYVSFVSRYFHIPCHSLTNNFTKKIIRDLGETSVIHVVSVDRLRGVSPLPKLNILFFKTMLPYSQLWARYESKGIEKESSQKVETERKQGASCVSFVSRYFHVPCHSLTNNFPCEMIERP